MFKEKQHVDKMEMAKIVLEKCVTCCTDKHKENGMKQQTVYDSNDTLNTHTHIIDQR